MDKSLPFHTGQRVKVNNDVGFITFVDTLYFTLCVKEWEDKDTLHGWAQVNVVVPNNIWNKVEIL